MTTFVAIRTGTKVTENFDQFQSHFQAALSFNRIRKCPFATRLFYVKKIEQTELEFENGFARADHVIQNH
jgi:hypothetical protein